MGIPVVIAENGFGLPVVDATETGIGMPMTIAENGYGTPIVIAENGYGIPAVFDPPLGPDLPAGFEGTSLFFNFMTDISIIDGTSTASTFPLTVTRATPPLAYAESTVGVWTGFAPGVARRTDKGLLIEEARTNSIRNNSMQGAVAGVIGSGGVRPTNWASFSGAGLTTTIVGVGVQNGIDYIDIRFNGTTNATQMILNFDTSGNIAASNAQGWYGSAFLALVGGSLTNVTAFNLALSQYNNVPSLLTTLAGANFNPTATLTRYSASFTTNQATIASVLPRLTVAVTNAAAVDFTIRIGWPQLELGAFATSPIRTTTAAVTRAQDVVNLNTAMVQMAWWFTNAAGTMFGEGSPYTGTLGTSTVLHIDAGASTDRHLIGLNGVGAASAAIAATNGASVAQASLNATSAAGVNKVAYAYATNDFAASYNGAAVLTDVAGTPPVITMTTVRIGRSTAATWGGYIRRLAYFPARLANATLQSLTAA